MNRGLGGVSAERRILVEFGKLAAYTSYTLTEFDDAHAGKRGPANDPALTMPERYEQRVQELEAEGLTRSDAQGAADAEAIMGADWAQA